MTVSADKTQNLPVGIVVSRERLSQKRAMLCACASQICKSLLVAMPGCCDFLSMTFRSGFLGESLAERF